MKKKLEWYSKQVNSPKFIVVSFSPDPVLCSKYKNIADYVYKYPKINGSELAYKIISAKRSIWKEQQDLLEKEKNKKVSYLDRNKRIFKYV